jgi:hypothetical protein
MQVELLDPRRWRTRVELANAILEYLETFHNRQRRHSSLGRLTPMEFETAKVLKIEINLLGPWAPGESSGDHGQLLACPISRRSDVEHHVGPVGVEGASVDSDARSGSVDHTERRLVGDRYHVDLQPAASSVGAEQEMTGIAGGDEEPDGATAC